MSGPQNGSGPRPPGLAPDATPDAPDPAQDGARLAGRQDDVDPRVARAARLLASRRQRPVTAAAQQRVWAQLDERQGRARLAWVLRPAVLVAVLLGFVAASSATEAGRRLVARVLGVPARATGVEGQLPRAGGMQGKAKERVEGAGGQGVVGVGGVAVQPTVVGLPAGGGEGAPMDEARVYDAEVALHGRRDAARAAGMLDEYLARHPNGALAEEALRLAIEASMERGDGRAAGFGERYLKQFPGGRFAGLARFVVGGAAAGSRSRARSTSTSTVRGE